MGQTEDRVTEIEEHVAALTADAADVPPNVDTLASLPGTSDIETELRHLRNELTGLRNDSARAFDEIRTRLNRLEGQGSGGNVRS